MIEIVKVETPMDAVLLVTVCVVAGLALGCAVTWGRRWWYRRNQKPSQLVNICGRIYRRPS